MRSTLRGTMSNPEAPDLTFDGMQVGDVFADSMIVVGAETMLMNRVSRNVVYAPAYTIMGGTTQILRNIIGERILGLPREPRPKS